MLFSKSQRKPRRWNNGWIGLAALTILFVVFFTVGKLTSEYEPDPIIEGRNLSEWTDDLDLYVQHKDPHYRAVSVLKSHKGELNPVLLQWLEETDSIPQKVYFTTMLILRNEDVRFRGARFNQAAAADALREIGDSDKEVCDALRRVVDQHGGELKHISVNAARRALSDLSDCHE